MTTQAPPTTREVVAVVIRHEGELCLMRRSADVAWDAGLWHCVTGYVEPGTDPALQALTELEEETGVEPGTGTVAARATIEVDGWTVHAFAVTVAGRGLRLNWENDDVWWTPPDRVGERPTVWWLHDVLEAL